MAGYPYFNPYLQTAYPSAYPSPAPQYTIPTPYPTPAPIPYPQQIAQNTQAAQNQTPASGGGIGNGVIWVQGEAGAKSFMVQPGNSVMLMDSDEDYFFIKSADQSGMPSLRKFKYEEVSEEGKRKVLPEIHKDDEFVSKAEFCAFKDEIQRAFSTINASSVSNGGQEL